MMLLQCVMLVSAVVAVAYAEKPPNILFIMSDDLGYGEVGVYPAHPPNNRERIPTPNIDKLAKEGIQFTAAYTGQAVCAPSRCSMMTGKHTGHTWIRGNAGVPCPTCLTGHSDLPLRPNDTTIAQVLKTRGYYTALVGKWGLGDNSTTGAPRNKGFDYYYGQLDQAYCHQMYPDAVWENEQQVFYPTNDGASRSRCMAPGNSCKWSHDLFTDTAMKVLTERAKDRQTPWFLFLSYTDPHAGGWTGKQNKGPYPETGAPVPSEGSFANKSWPNVEKDHASAISNFQDRDVGRLIDFLDNNGLSDDTMVVFASDNGAHNEGGHDVHFFNSPGPLRGFKRSLYEGGIRSPSIIRWTNTIQPAVSNYSWAFWDLLPTFAELSGVAKAELPEGLDGISIVPTLRGQQQAEKDFFYWEFCTNNKWGHAVRIGKWKAVSFAENEPYELYNLETDLGETNNVAANHPNIISQATAIAKREHEDNPYFPVKNCRSS